MTTLEALQKILKLAGSVTIDFDGEKDYTIGTKDYYFSGGPDTLKEVIEAMASYLEEEEAFKDEGRA